MKLGILLAQLGVHGLDGELSTCGHGIARVDGEVQNHLLELARVGPDVARVRREGRPERDVLADQAAEHLLHILNHIVHVQHDGLEHLLAAEGQQLPGETSRPLSRFADLPQHLALVLHQVNRVEKDNGVGRRDEAR